MERWLKNQKQRKFSRRWRKRHPDKVKDYYINNREEILKKKQDYYLIKKKERIQEAVEKVMDVKDGFEKAEARKPKGRTLEHYRWINKRLAARKNKVRGLGSGIHALTE